MTKLFPIFLMLVGFVFIGAACEKAADEQSNSNAATNRTNTSNLNQNEDDQANDDVSNRNAASNANSNVNRNVNANRNTNATDDDSDDDSDATSALRITGPEKNETVESPMTVEGKAPNGPVFVRVKTASGKTLFTVPATARNGEFAVKLTFEFTNTTSGSIEVYTQDADGNEDLAASVPVTFKVESGDDDNSNTNSNSNSNSNTNASDDDTADDTNDDNPAY